jgi:hypothetical protein
MIAVLGLAISVLGFAITLWAIGIRLLRTSAVPGWASTVVPTYTRGSASGCIGEHLAKICMETKRRPRYVIERMVGERADVAPTTATPPLRVVAGEQPGARPRE